VAEEERELISKRTKQGLIKARQAGKQLGKPSTIARDTVCAGRPGHTEQPCGCR
jgi:DNA invertase Pin-like site-specific DNA recombinase